MDDRPTSPWPLRLMIAGLLLALGGGALVWQQLRSGPRPAGEVPTHSEYADRRPLPAFSLSGPGGRFDQTRLRGQWSFVFFGYTQCPDICPTALGLMKALQAELAVPPALTFQVVFVSVDPRRDTPELLKAYLGAFDPAFVGLSGTDAELAPLADALGARYQRHDQDPGVHYTVDHTASIFLVDPEGRLAAEFPHPQEVGRLAAQVRRISGRS